MCCDGRGGLPLPKKQDILIPSIPSPMLGGESTVQQGEVRSPLGGLYCCSSLHRPSRLGRCLVLTIAPFCRPHTQHSRNSCCLAKNSWDSWRRNQLPSLRVLCLSSPCPPPTYTCQCLLGTKLAASSEGNSVWQGSRSPRDVAGLALPGLLHPLLEQVLCAALS